MVHERRGRIVFSAFFSMYQAPVLQAFRKHTEQSLRWIMEMDPLEWVPEH